MSLAAILAALVSASPVLPVGTIDTIGGTVYDCSMICAGQQRMVTYDPGYGVHVAWVYSAEMHNTAFPDRNTRYNFRSDLTGEWVAIDSSSYMNSGVNVYQARNGYGGIDHDPVGHVPVITAHAGSPIHPIVARDLVAGACAWEYADGSPLMDSYQWPWLAVSASGTVHSFIITAAYLLGYSRMAAWGAFEPVRNVFLPDPGFPTHIITASKLSDRVAALWEYSVTDDAFYLSQTVDDGLSWSPPLRMDPPPAYGGDTIAYLHLSSLGANYDRDDNLNIIAAVHPVVGDSWLYLPAEVWHWSARNTPNWHRVHRVECASEHLAAPLGYQSIYACRPKVAQNPADGKLFVIWSQFDSANVEPVTNLLRADVWLASSADNGYTWSRAQNLTGPDSASEMYCDIAPCVNDTLHIVYIADLQAGMFVQGQGDATENPVIYRRIPANAIAVAEGVGAESRVGLLLTPNPAPGRVRLDGAGRAWLYDRAGRRRAELAAGWNLLTGLGPGVYFVRAAGREAKLVVTR